MAIHLIPTKITIPRRDSGVVRRPRLLEFLHENLERKLLLVTAPAGYGKTTLVIDFASEVELPVCWFTLDEGDRDPSTFLAHLVASIRQKFPNFGERSMSMSQSGMMVARAAAGALVADMVSDVPEYFVLVLDDWHLVGEEAVIRELLDHLLHYLPEHAHIVVAGRTLPRGPLIRLTAQGAVAGLGPGDLRFTPSEVREVLAQKYDLEITEEQAVKLADESEGWITGILLTSQAMWKSLLAGLVHAVGAPGALYEYLAGDVFDQLSLPLRRFLLESAVPRQFTAELCDEVRGVPGSGVWIDQVEARNLFLTRVEVDGDTWFRYHHLFRDFLLARFKRDDPQALARLNLRSGEFFEARQEAEGAVEHYLAGGAPERAARVMDTHSRRLYMAGRTQTLLNWTALLPPQHHSRAPELVLFQGQTLTERGRPKEALTVLKEAEAVFQARGDEIGQVRAILPQGWAYYALGELRESLAVGQRVRDRLDDARADHVVWRAQALRLLGLCHSGMGQLQTGEAFLSEALALYRSSASRERRDFDLARATHDLALTLRSLGRLEEAAALEAESLVLWRRIGNPGPLALSLNSVGYDRYLAGDYDGALATYTEAIAKAEESGDVRTQALIMDGFAAVFRDRGEFQRAIDVYEDIFNMASEIGDQSLVSLVLDGLGHAHRLSEGLDRAVSLFEQARSVALRGGIDSQAILSEASIGMARFEQGDVSPGIQRLEHAGRALRESGSHLDLARVLFWLARAYFETGRHAEARESLAEMLRLSGRLGYRPFSSAEGRRAEAFLQWAASLPDADSRLRLWIEELRAARAAVTPGAPVEVVAAPRIEAQAFGAGQVVRAGRLLAASEWGGSAAARELFFYLLEKSPQRKEEIGAVFWPDLSPARLTNAFHAVKYRIRRALDMEFIIYEDDRYRLNPAIDYGYDVAEFEQLLGSAARRPADDPRRYALLDKALALYTGDYLTGIYSEWALDKRRVLQAQFLDALNQLLPELLRREEYERAEELSRRGIDVDYFREELHRGLMWSLARTGRRAEAVAHYKTLAQLMRRELRVSPSQETRDLFLRIRAQR
ncbi:MAG TPA: tetratricopeptide repeat protein [Anaerolineae bacterium]|nr:tetratricopeptide repeat protein [Anaerolineae bacterium]